MQGNPFLKYSDGSIYKAMPVIPMKCIDFFFFLFLTGLFAHRKLQQHRFVIKGFPQTLYLNSKFSSAALGEKNECPAIILFLNS